MCAIPAFRALREALPEAQIALVGLPWSQAFVERFNYYLDDYIEFPGYPGLPERAPQIDRLPQFLTDLQWLDFDLALQMQGSGSITNSLVELFGAYRSAGFYLPGQYCPDAGLYLPYPVHENEIWRHLRLMEYLGLPLQGDDLEFPLYREDWNEFAALEARFGLQTGEYVCLHPGSRAADRRWPTERFAAVADGLVQRGWQVILTGTAEESYLTAAVARQTQGFTAGKIIDLAGETSLGALGALLSWARLLVCNDTGVSHVAAALRTPSVVLFSASDPNRWAPGDRRMHRVIPWATAAGPEQVLGEVERMLAQERVYA